MSCLSSAFGPPVSMHYSLTSTAPVDSNSKASKSTFRAIGATVGTVFDRRRKS
jgi:hypothetical protein